VVNPILQAPFPWFGGKSRVADLVWQRIGDVPNYVEPFLGSGAVLLGRPPEPKIETVNDLDGFVAFSWRALRADPAAVAEWADNPVNENDLHARHIWRVGKRDTLTAQLEGDPDFYDAKFAGWWAWGICCWIGSGWCSGKGPWSVIDGMLTNANAGQGVNRKLPHLGSAGRGVNRQLPLLPWFQALAERLRNVRVTCGDWERVTGPSPTEKLGMTGIFLDPPYADTASRTPNVYAKDSLSVAHEVREWAIKNGENPMLRIALCGYEGEHAMPPSWDCVAWKALGGYGNRNDDNENATRERIWFSSACLSARQGSLF
jgi:hypothetical protein